MRYRTKSSKASPKFTYLAPDGSEIVETESIKDLGIIMSSNLNVRDHKVHINQMSTFEWMNPQNLQYERETPNAHFVEITNLAQA